jgi:hypothetical protein
MAMEEDAGRGYCYARRESTRNTCFAGATFSPARPSDCFAIDFPRHAISPGEGLPIVLTSP